MQVRGALRRHTAISFAELRALLGAGEVWQSTTALPDEVVVGISAQRPGAEIQISGCVPTVCADAFAGSHELGWIIVGETSEACEAARAFLQKACKRARIEVTTP